MSLPLRWQFLYICIVYQLNVSLTLSSSSLGTNFTRWSEDDWYETRFLINTKFIFNRQRYEHLTLRTRMNEWSLELSYGNGSHRNKIWTELHLFLHDRTSLNNSISGHIRNLCDPPIISPLTNDSATNIPQLTDMDQHIAKFFVSDGFFRTINYIHCKIDERRRDPPLHIQFDIYLVTNREFQSLLYIQMSNTTRQSLFDLQASFYLHNHERKFKYNLNISEIHYPLNTNTTLVHMIKLYNQVTYKANNVVMISSNIVLIWWGCFFSFIK